MFMHVLKDKSDRCKQTVRHADRGEASEGMACSPFSFFVVSYLSLHKLATTPGLLPFPSELRQHPPVLALQATTLAGWEAPTLVASPLSLPSLERRALFPLPVDVTCACPVAVTGAAPLSMPSLQQSASLPPPARCDAPREARGAHRWARWRSLEQGASSRM
eukprot:1056062-Pelagomonas_calceolata.AAC.1